MRACCDRGISRAVRGSGLTGAAISLLRTAAGDSIGSTRGFRAGCSADGTPSETDGSAGCRFGVKSASAAWRALVVRSLSSPRGWCCCSRWLSKGCPDCLATRGLEVEFVNFGNSLLHMLGDVAGAWLDRSSQQTPRWREPDSNSRSHPTAGGGI